MCTRSGLLGSTTPIASWVVLTLISGSFDNDIGVPYILTSKPHGRALSEYEWAEGAHKVPGYPSPGPRLPLPENGRERVMSQLGTIMEQLSETRFEKIGSLVEDPNGHYSVGECLSPSLLWQSRDSLDGIDRGSISKERRYLDSLVSAFTSQAMELPLTLHIFFAPISSPYEYPNWHSFRTAVDRLNNFVAIGQKIDSSTNRLPFCIAGQLLREMIP